MHTLEADSILFEFGTRKILSDIYLKCETGKIIGNINCGSLGIREGAYFSGACKMQEPKIETPNPND